MMTNDGRDDDATQDDFSYRDYFYNVTFRRVLERAGYDVDDIPGTTLRRLYRATLYYMVGGASFDVAWRRMLRIHGGDA